MTRRALIWTARILVWALAVVGAVTIGRELWDKVPRAQKVAEPAKPASSLPGPPRGEGEPAFVLTAENSFRMIGAEDFPNARWFDVDNNLYSPRFIEDFRYEDTSMAGPEVRVRIDPTGDTVRGRLEARRMKPNFVYQIKLRGVFSDRRSFEAIGYTGRWRLPGWGTNYDDWQYQSYRDKSRVEAYLLFDFFATDRNGNGIREFALDSSLHVLFKARQSYNRVPMRHMVAVTVDASNPDDYLYPKRNTVVHWVWAQREHVRYSAGQETIRLPPGSYQAEIVLTEESFHSSSSGGGYWATVMHCPVSFTITD